MSELNLNRKLLEKGLRWMDEEGGIPQQHQQKLAEFIKESSLADLQRINPLVWADEHGLEEGSAGKLFVTAAKAGILVMEWDLICPFCGGVESHASIGEINRDSYYCILCEADAELDLNDHVEVVFSVSPEIAGTLFTPFTDQQSYWKYHFSRSLVRPPAIEQYISSLTKGWFVIPSGESRHIRLKNLKPGARYRLVSIDKGISQHISVRDTDPSETPIIIDGEIGPDGISPEPVEVPPCDLTISLRNETPSKVGFSLIAVNKKKAQEVFSENQISFRPLFTGKKLLNNQSFRNLFKKEDIPDNLHLKTGDVTILFTDLKGSTELYEKTGDLKAYSLVQQHFDLLMAEVDKHQGALIKTIGDAVMAAFSTPEEALQSALGMVKAIEEMNRETSREGHEIAIKVGLHQGSAIAVNANDRLDYFGQTVNVAARVQGLAAGGEIWITEDIQRRPESEGLLKGAGYRLVKQMAELKGVSQPTPVYQCLH